MKLYAARHGETVWNERELVSGLTDVELTEKGLKQAEILAEKMRDKKIDVIIASPLQRARITAEKTARIFGLEVITDERLIEQNYGIYEGVSRFDEGFLRNKSYFAYNFPGGESMMKTAQRVYNFLDEIKEKYSGKNVLVVCHNGVIRVLNTYFNDLTNQEYFNYTLDNCGYEEYDL